MPYIQGDRSLIYPSADRLALTPGELNYQLTILIQNYWEHTRNYQGINDIIGALEGAKLEFYRRVVAPYEDTKIEQNGDVYY